jgi:CheY-like chemotaxis protein
MPGPELARAIKSDPQLAATPVVILPAYAEAAHRPAGLEVGADL